MKKLMGLFLLGFGLCVMSSLAYSAASVRGAKGSTTIFGGTSPIGVSTGTAVVYSVGLSTGTAGTDFVVLFDSASANGLSSTLQASGGYKIRVNVSSSTQNTLVVFDPPLQFKNGIMAANSSANITSVITYEGGHVTQGY